MRKYRLVIKESVGEETVYLIEKSFLNREWFCIYKTSIKLDAYSEFDKIKRNKTEKIELVAEEIDV